MLACSSDSKIHSHLLPIGSSLFQCSIWPSQKAFIRPSSKAELQAVDTGSTHILNKITSGAVWGQKLNPVTVTSPSQVITFPFFGFYWLSGCCIALFFAINMGVPIISSIDRALEHLQSSHKNRNIQPEAHFQRLITRERQQQPLINSIDIDQIITHHVRYQYGT